MWCHEKIRFPANQPFLLVRNRSYPPSHVTATPFPLQGRVRALLPLGRQQVPEKSQHYGKDINPSAQRYLVQWTPISRLPLLKRGRLWHLVFCSTGEPVSRKTPEFVKHTVAKDPEESSEAGEAAFGTLMYRLDDRILWGYSQVNFQVKTKLSCINLCLLYNRITTYPQFCPHLWII